MNITAEEHFRRMPAEAREKTREQYRSLIAYEEGRIEKYNKLTGKIMKVGRMTWMLSHWKEGLSVLEKVISESNIVTM